MPHFRSPNLGSLRVFEVVARRGSLVAAALELHVTHGAVSKQIRTLEQDLDALLFERRNRGVHLTTKGRWLAERLRPLFIELEQIQAEFRDLDDQPRPLTISCEPTLCLRLLIPVIARLKRETGIDVRIAAAGGPVDFRRGDIDAAIRRSDFHVAPDTESTRLAAEYMGPVLPPAEAARPFHHLPLLLSETRPDAWRDWMAASGIGFSGPVIRYEHFYLALQAAQAGQGVAMASFHMVADDLAADRLQAPYGFLADGTDYVALRPRHQTNDQVDRLTMWVAKLMASNQAAMA